MELIEKSCAYKKCSSIFRVLPSDEQECCSRVCHEKAGIISNRKTQGELLFATKRYRDHLSKAKEEKMEKFGMMAHGELKKVQSEEKRSAKNMTNQKKEKKLGPAPREKEEKGQNKKQKIKKEVGNTTETIKSLQIKEDQKTGQKTKIATIKHSENGMQKTGGKSVKKSEAGDTGQIQPSDSNQVSMRIEEERSGTVKLLTDSSEHLVTLGKSLAAPRMDDFNKPIQMATSHNVEVAIKCFSEARNIMKTKLEYLKLAKELSNGAN